MCSESVLYVSVSSDVVADNIALEFCSALVGLSQGILLQGGKLVSLLGVKVVKAFCTCCVGVSLVFCSGVCLCGYRP